MLDPTQQKRARVQTLETKSYLAGVTFIDLLILLSPTLLMRTLGRTILPHRPHK